MTDVEKYRISEALLAGVLYIYMFLLGIGFSMYHYYLLLHLL